MTPAQSTSKALVSMLLAFVAITVFAGFALADSLKCRAIGHVRSVERVPVGDMEGHHVQAMVRIGVFTCDTGEAGNFTNVSTARVVPGGAEAQGYTLWEFEDGSAFLMNFQQAYTAPTSGQAQYASQSKGELLSGTGRFKGITGTVAYTGKGLKLIKGELGSRSIDDFTLTYTLPEK